MSDVLSTYEVNVNESLHLQPTQDSNNSAYEDEQEEKKRQLDMQAQVDAGIFEGILEDEEENYASEMDDEEEEGEEEEQKKEEVGTLRTSTPIRFPLPPPLAPAGQFQSTLTPMVEHPSEGLLVDPDVLHELEWWRAEYNKLEQQAFALNAKNEALMCAVDQLKQENSQLRLQYEQAEEASERERAESSRAIQTLNGRLQEAEGAEQLKQQMIEVRAELQRGQAEAQMSAKELQTLAKENEKLNGMLCKTDAVLKEFQARLTSMNEENEVLCTKLREADVALNRSEETIEELRKSQTEAERLKQWRDECCEREFNLLEPEKRFTELTRQLALLREKEAASVGLAEQLARSRTEAEKTRAMYQEIVGERDALELKLRQEFERDYGLKMERQLSARLAEERQLLAEKQKQEREEADAKARHWHQNVQAELQAVQKELAEARQAVGETRRQKMDAETRLTTEIYELKRRLCEVDATSKQAAQSHDAGLQQLQDKKNALETELQAVQKELTEARHAVDEVRRQRTDVETKLIGEIHELKRRLCEVDVVSKQAPNQAAGLQRLQDEKSALETELQRVQKELAEARQAVDEARRQRTDAETRLSNEIHGLKRRLCEVEAASKLTVQSHATELQRLEEEKSALKAELERHAGLRAELEAAQKEAERLKSTVISIGARNSELEKELAAASKANDLERRLADREAEFEQARAAWKKEAELRFFAFQNECRAKLSELMGRLGAERDLTTKLDAEAKSLREQLIQLEQDKQRALEELAKRHVEEQEAAQTRHKLLVKKAVRDRVLRHEAASKATAAEIDELRARLEAAGSSEEQLAETRAAAALSEAELAESRREVARLKAEARTQRQTTEQLRQSLTDSSRLVDSLRLEIEGLHHEKTELKTRCDDLDDEVRRLAVEQRRARDNQVQILEGWKKKLLNHMDVHAASVHDDVAEYLSADRANITAQINGWLVQRVRGHFVQSGLKEGLIVKFIAALRRDLETTLTPLPLPESLNARSTLPDSLTTTPPQSSPPTSIRRSASSSRKSTVDVAKPKSATKTLSTPRKPFRC